MSDDRALRRAAENGHVAALQGAGLLIRSCSNYRCGKIAATSGETDRDALRSNQSLMKECSRCREAFYCSVECQNEHWPWHKDSCDFGRFAHGLVKLLEKDDVANRMVATLADVDVNGMDTRRP